MAKKYIEHVAKTKTRNYITQDSFWDEIPQVNAIALERDSKR